ncbi:MAG: hypothetical protein GDA39_07370 [Hyphomonadaceae bacterium]|nr:hypothetical protein [Hyphomonadaceae bacterium]MBC6412694.1 hypothetical protein [Hyphomonadaceae bacterium]
MYNLLVAANKDDFQGRPWVLELGEYWVFGYTAESIEEHYCDLTPENREELCGLPAVFAYVGSCDQAVRLGKIENIRTRPSKVRFEYSFIPGLPEIPANRLPDLEWELDFGEAELRQAIWAVKDVDLRAVLIAGDIVSERQFAKLPDPYRALFQKG